MKYLFWVVLAAVLVVALGVYFVVVPGIHAESAELRAAIDTKAGEVRKYAKDSKKIVGGQHVQAAQAYRKHLEEQQKEVVEAWKGKGFTLSEEYLKAPTDTLRFDGWLIEKRAAIMKKIEEGGFKVPDGFAKTYLYEGLNLPSNDEPKRQEWLRQVAIVEELVSALSSVKAAVTKLEFEPDEKKPEATKPASVGILSLDKLTLIPVDQTALAETATYNEALKLAGTSGATEKAPAALSSAQRLRILFTAPAVAVAPAIQRLESSPRWFGVVRRIDTQRITAAFPSLDDLNNLAPKAEDTPAKLAAMKVNTHYQEAAIQCLVDVDLLEFDWAAAKKMLEPPAPPPAAKGSKASKTVKKTN